MRILPSAVALAAALAAAPSLAAPLSAEVTVERAPEAADCPSAGELQAAIERIVQRPVVAAHGERLVADVQFLRGKDGNDGFEALVRLAGAKQGERRLTDTGGSCAPLAQAVAVTLALLVDLGPEPRPMPSVSPLDPRSRGEIWLFGGGGLGLTAGPTAAGGGGAAVAWARWSLRASGGAVLPREAELSPGSVRVGLARGELLLCRALASGLRARLDACAGGTIGWLSGRGQGYPVSMNAGFWWVAAEAAIRLGGVVGGRFLWGLQAGLAVPSARHTFSVENAGVAYRSSPVAGLLELQVGARLW